MAGRRRSHASLLRRDNISAVYVVHNILLGVLTLALRSNALSLEVFNAKLVVLNAPRYGDQLVGNVSYHARKPISTGGWLLFSLVFGPTAAPPGSELKTGDTVRLVVDLDQSGFVAGTAKPTAAFAGPLGSLYVVSWAGVPDSGAVDPLSPGSSNVYYTGGTAPLRLSAAVWAVTSVCGVEVGRDGMTAQDITDMLFGAPAGAALHAPGPPSKHYPSVSLSRLLYECSYGNMVLKRSNTVVVNLSLPCSGVRPNGAAWNATRGSAGVSGTCGNNELWGWMEHAVQNTRQLLGIDVSNFRRRVLVLPPSDGGSGKGAGMLCPSWQQRGSFGCDESLGCDMWIRGDRSGLLQGLMGQLGSSLLLQPAAVSVSPVGPNPLANSGQPADPTCPTGASAEEGAYKCFNGPSAYKLRLATPRARLDAGSGLFDGDSRLLQLPAAALATDNLLLVVPNWQPHPSAAPRPLFGQYRAPVGGDAGLAAAAGRLVLHSVVNATEPPRGTEAATPSVLLVALSLGESYRFEPAKVLVRFESVLQPTPEDAGGVTGGAAAVSVCRYQSTAERDWDCYDGVDNDCDGLADYDDPDCATA